MIDLQIYNCTYYLRLKLKVAIQGGSELFFIKVYLFWVFFIILMVYTVMK